MTAAEKRLEAPLQPGKAAGFLGVIHNEGPPWIKRAACRGRLARSTSATAKRSHFYCNCFADEWQGLLWCLVVSFRAAAPSKRVLGVCSRRASRNMARDSERTAFGGHRAVLSVLLGEKGDGTRYFGEQLGISCPQDGVGRFRPEGSPALCPFAVSRTAWLLCREIFLRSYLFSFVSSTLFAVSCSKSLLHMLIAFYWSHFCCSFCSLLSFLPEVQHELIQYVNTLCC